MVNFIVRDAVGAALQNEHSNRWRIYQAEMMQMVVRENLAVRLFKRLCALRRFTNANSARANVKNLVADDFVSLAASPKIQRVTGQVRE